MAKPRAWTARMVTRLRARLGWSQADLAAHVGVTWAAVSAWERGKSQPGPHARAALEQISGG